MKLVESIKSEIEKFISKDNEDMNNEQNKTRNLLRHFITLLKNTDNKTFSVKAH